MLNKQFQAKFYLTKRQFFFKFVSDLICSPKIGKKRYVLYPATLKSALYYVIPSIQKFFTIFGIPLPIFFKLGMRVDIVKECSGIADG